MKIDDRVEPLFREAIAALVEADAGAIPARSPPSLTRKP